MFFAGFGIDQKRTKKISESFNFALDVEPEELQAAKSNGFGNQFNDLCACEVFCPKLAVSLIQWELFTPMTTMN